MKKLLLALVILLTSCTNPRINGIPLNEGDTKTYETKDYLIIYEVESFTFGITNWKFKGIINKKDSI